VPVSLDVLCASRVWSIEERSDIQLSPLTRVAPMG
jgi:hypothetical protein